MGREVGEAHGNHEGRLAGVAGGGGFKEVLRAEGAGPNGTRPATVCVNGRGKVFYSNTHYGESGRPAFWAIRGW